MNSPVVILRQHLPEEIINKIQSFIPPNSIVYRAIKRHICHVRKRFELYDKFVNYEYKNIDRSGRKYWPSNFIEIFYENPQYSNIIFYDTPIERLTTYMVSQISPRIVKMKKAHRIN